MNPHRTIRGIVIPVNQDEPPRVEQVRADATTYQEIVGGWLEAISGDGWTAYVNEDGKATSLPVNVHANQILATLGWVGFAFDFVVGPVLLVGPPDANSDDTDLPDAVLARVQGDVR